MLLKIGPLVSEVGIFSQEDFFHMLEQGLLSHVTMTKTISRVKSSSTTIIGDNVSERINEIKQPPNGGNNDFLLFSSPTATHSLIQLNLVDGFWLFVNPIILGQGIPLFTDIKDKIKLHLVTTRQFDCGVTELNYTVDR